MPQFIARHWHGHCPLEHSSRFHSYLQNEVDNIPEKTAAFLCRVDTANSAHFYVCTFWENLHLLKSFAGDDLAVPVSDPFDIECGVVSDSIVTHFITSEISSRPFRTAQSQLQQVIGRSSLVVELPETISI